MSATLATTAPETAIAPLPSHEVADLVYTLVAALDPTTVALLADAVDGAAREAAESGLNFLRADHQLQSLAVHIRNGGRAARYLAN